MESDLKDIVSGRLTNDKFNLKVEDQKDTFTTQMEAITVMTLATKQKPSIQLLVFFSGYFKVGTLNLYRIYKKNFK